MTRKRFTEREVLETLLSDGNMLLCFRCRQPLGDAKDAEREHILEIALGGKDEPANCAYSHKWCHFAITNGTKATTAGSSKNRIAKVKRIIANRDAPLIAKTNHQQDRARGIKDPHRRRGFRKPPPGFKHNWKTGRVEAI